MGRGIFSTVLVLVLLTGSAWAQTAGGPVPETSVPETEGPCLEAGGRWERGGLAGELMCFLPTPDAGKACTAAEDCTGFCLAESGTCSAESPMFGCFAIVDLDGAAVTLCID